MHKEDKLDEQKKQKSKVDQLLIAKHDIEINIGNLEVELLTLEKPVIEKKKEIAHQKSRLKDIVEDLEVTSDVFQMSERGCSDWLKVFAFRNPQYAEYVAVFEKNKINGKMFIGNEDDLLELVQGEISEIHLDLLIKRFKEDMRSKLDMVKIVGRSLPRGTEVYIYWNSSREYRFGTLREEWDRLNPVSEFIKVASGMMAYEAHTSELAVALVGKHPDRIEGPWPKEKFILSKEDGIKGFALLTSGESSEVIILQVTELGYICLMEDGDQMDMPVNRIKLRN